MSSDTLNKTPGGPENLLWNLQEADLSLKRFTIKASRAKGQVANRFSSNSGPPYKYIVDTDPKPFIQITRWIHLTLARANFAARPFNKILAVGSLEGNKMGYHDDGKSTLGPTVAAFSLGGDCSFNSSPKTNLYSGFTDKGNKYDPNMPCGPLSRRTRSMQNPQRHGPNHKPSELDYRSPKSD